MAINLYLIRHGIAVERGSYTNDFERPLTEKGKEKTTQVAEKLAQMGLNFDVILTSPFVRALQTAQIFQKSGLTEIVETDLSLTPDENLENWLSQWQKSKYNQNGNQIALVGHQPNLGQWTEQLIAGQIVNRIILKKAGLIGIKIPVTVNPIGRSELFLLTSPKWLIST